MKHSDWPTKEKDLALAKKILHQYSEDITSLCIFESLNDPKKQYRLADWVDELTDCFYELYGKDHGEFITKKILSSLLVNGQVIH